MLAATIFHFQGSSLPEARAYLRERGLSGPSMRLARFSRSRSRAAAPPATAPCVRPTRAGTQVQGEVRVCPGRYRIADPASAG